MTDGGSHFSAGPQSSFSSPDCVLWRWMVVSGRDARDAVLGVVCASVSSLVLSSYSHHLSFLSLCCRSRRSSVSFIDHLFWVLGSRYRSGGSAQRSMNQYLVTTSPPDRSWRSVKSWLDGCVHLPSILSPANPEGYQLTKGCRELRSSEEELPPPLSSSSSLFVPPILGSQ